MRFLKRFNVPAMVVFYSCCLIGYIGYTNMVSNPSLVETCAFLVGTIAISMHITFELWERLREIRAHNKEIKELNKLLKEKDKIIENLHETIEERRNINRELQEAIEIREKAKWYLAIDKWEMFAEIKRIRPEDFFS